MVNETKQVEPERCLAIILGASSWPNCSQFSDSPIFRRSAERFRDYLLSDEGFALPNENLLDLFDSPELSVTIMGSINNFLSLRSAEMRKQEGRPLDIIVYYVGHGDFAGNDKSYFLAIESTQKPDELLSSIPVTSLAKVLKEQARYLRCYLILDSCFSAAAYNSFQGVACTALLCSSGPTNTSRAPDGSLYTMFTEAFIDVLSSGSEQSDPVLSLDDLQSLISQRLREKHQDKAVLPEVHSPSQGRGNMAKVPIFQNHFFRQGEKQITRKKRTSNFAVPPISANFRRVRLGPIVGHTTDKTCRIWVQAQEPEDRGAIDSHERMTIGVVAVVAKNRKRIKRPKAHYFRLHRNFNRTGTFTLGTGYDLTNQASYKLQAGTDYKIRVGVLTIDMFSTRTDVIEDKEVIQWLPPKSVVAEELLCLHERDSEASFHTYPAPPPNGKPSDPISFLFGTCSYREMPSHSTGQLQVFRSIQNAAKKNEGNRPKFLLVFMSGDQANIDSHENSRLEEINREILDHYSVAFASGELRKLLACLPTYMVFDDQEMLGNKTPTRLKKASSRAALRYQWSHGSRSWNNSYLPSDKENLSEVEECLHNPHTALLYYDFLCAGYPFFVLDTRTQRYQDDASGLADNHLLGRPSQHPTEPGQLDRLCHWLQYQQCQRGNVPKFIVSSSVFVPNTVKSTRGGHKNQEESDSWSTFPNTRRALLDCIVENMIENVIFLSGDVNCSSVAPMTFSQGPANFLTAYCITSSAFYWPFPFAEENPADYVHDSKNGKNKDSFDLSEGLGKMDYTAWGFSQAESFCRIDIDPNNCEILFHLFDSEGNPIKRRKWNGTVNTMPQRLRLACW